MKFWWPILLIFISCRSGFNSLKLSSVALTDSYAGSIINQPSLSSEDNDKETFTQTFRIGEVVGDTIAVAFTQSDSLIIAGRCNGKQKEWRFRGRFSADGYFVVTFRKNNDWGLINSSRDENSVYLILSDSGELVVEDYLRNEKRFLLWGVGGIFRSQRVYESVNMN